MRNKQGRAVGVVMATCLFFLGIGPLLDVVDDAHEHEVAHAIPAFARKFNVPCQTCHSAAPYLNATGRKFMEAGYRLPDEDGAIDEAEQNHQTINQNLVLEKF